MDKETKIERMKGCPVRSSQLKRSTVTSKQATQKLLDKEKGRNQTYAFR